MNVTIIGTGNMARGISTRLVAAGHAVSVHAKDTAKGATLVADVTAAAQKGGSITVAAIGSTTDEVVILATPYTEVESVAATYGGFAGKTVVDITNPVDFQTFQLIPEAGTSGAEAIATLAPQAKVVKAFNTTFAGVLAVGQVDGGKLVDVFVAGDDQAAKDGVSAIINDSGMRAIDAGALANARHLEGIALIHMAAQQQLGTTWMSALQIVA